MDSFIKRADVPASQQGRVPWGTPLERWPASMLEAGIKCCEQGFFDNLRRALAVELGARRRERSYA